MSQPELNPDAVDNRKQRRRGKIKGRVVDLNALLEVQNLLGAESRARDLLIEHLHKIQDHYGHLSAAHLTALAHEMRLATTEVYEVASFYHHFDVVREGETAPPALTVRVCDSVSCEMAGSEELIGALEASLGDGVRVQRVPCVGRCDKAPVAVVKQYTVDNATPDAVTAALDAGKTEQPMPQGSIDYEQYRAAEAPTKSSKPSTAPSCAASVAPVFRSGASGESCATSPRRECAPSISTKASPARSRIVSTCCPIRIVSSKGC
jgi:formate dehydrogenase